MLNPKKEFSKAVDDLLLCEELPEENPSPLGSAVAEMVKQFKSAEKLGQSALDGVVSVTVKFRKINGEVCALFLNFITDIRGRAWIPGAGLRYCESYSHCGQHGITASYWLVGGKVPTVDECANLINELNGLGYSMTFLP